MPAPFSMITFLREPPSLSSAAAAPTTSSAKCIIDAITIDPLHPILIAYNSQQSIVVAQQQRQQQWQQKKQKNWTSVFKMMQEQKEKDRMFPPRSSFSSSEPFLSDTVFVQKKLLHSYQFSKPFFLAILPWQQRLTQKEPLIFKRIEKEKV